MPVRPVLDEAIEIVSLEEFVAVDEGGAEPLIGEPGAITIPENSDVMFYGDGGAGKTTLCVELAFHLSAGDDWLEIPVPRPARVLLIEAEGPRPLFRAKLRRKHEGWDGSPLQCRLRVFEKPWAQFTFATEEWRTRLPQAIKEHEIDVLIAGPLVELAMDAAGTLQEVRAFMRLVATLRQDDRNLTVILVHHESKSGAVSGAWEGAGDTLVHVSGAGNGHTVLHFQKARWDHKRHTTRLKLEWHSVDSFRLEGDRDYHAEVTDLLADGTPRTIDEIRQAFEVGKTEVTQVVKGNGFVMITGSEAVALGRRSNAKLY